MGFCAQTLLLQACRTFFFLTGLVEVRVGVRKNPVLYLFATVECILIQPDCQPHRLLCQDE